MKSAPRSVLREYLALIRAHLAHAGEPTLERAYDLGRKSLDCGLGVVDVAALYHRALARSLLRQRSRAECVSTVNTLESLFVESLTPYEMTHRGYREAQATLRRLNELLEDEAKRIARMLHDESGQLLVAVHIALEDLARDLLPSHQGRVQKVRMALDEMEQQLRRVSRELRPPVLDDLGLRPALQYLAEGFSRRTGVKVVLEIFTEERFDSRVEIALYRIVQEALTNVSKHAQASRVVIRIRRSTKRRLTCFICDNGKGFDISRVTNAGIEGGLGLPGIRERLKALDAAFSIKSSPGQGTELLIQIPVAS